MIRTGQVAHLGPLREQDRSVTAEAVIFDCDGLLVDSESVWMELIASWLPQGTPTADTADTADTALEDFRGLGVDESARRLAELLGSPASAAGIESKLTARYSSLLAEGVRPMPGAVELVEALSGVVPLAVASNGLRADVLAMLADVGILERVDVVRTLDDVAAGKPAPDLYLAAAAALGVAPEQTVAFEDSPAGSRAAQAAGTTVIGVNADTGVELACALRLTRLTDVETRVAPEGVEGRD
ncbi:HAD family hydrolase [Nesterenkonia suensis]